ncbi:MAG TPA: FAD-binding oxidoreductase, partial [Ktedonobacterales bacterium]|nr:FAD-binding oxidoreductase [Ktedonobacterales bacterium]
MKMRAEPEPGQRLDVGVAETLEGYGMRNRGRCRVVRPRTPEEIAAVFEAAARAGETVGLRGGGCSYGDAALNSGHVLLDLSRMNRVVAWDPQVGELTVEPGVTIAQVWQTTLADGWWPPVVPGTMAVTIGGAASANIHGKNNWRDGSFGEHIVRFDLLLPSGQLVTCSPDQHADLYFSAIGGWGLLGCFTSITVRLRRIYSGLVRVRQTA